MTNKCPNCGDLHTDFLRPKSNCDPANSTGDPINDTCEVLLVCGKCGYLGPPTIGNQELAKPSQDATGWLRSL